MMLLGTVVYEEKRAESLKIMQDSKNKQDQISEVLAFIEEVYSQILYLFHLPLIFIAAVYYRGSESWKERKRN
jgi:hypothetical protein